jgi:hypothetical protein
MFIRFYFFIGSVRDVFFCQIRFYTPFSRLLLHGREGIGVILHEGIPLDSNVRAKRLEAKKAVL